MKADYITIPLAIIVAGVIIGGAFYLSQPKQNLSKAGLTSTQLSNVTAGMRPVTADDHILGNPNADVVIVEYSDTECPYCKQFQSTMQRVMNEYGPTGQVAWVYRQFPIKELHSKAPNEAEATECVNELGGPAKFWSFLNLIYSQTPSDNGLDPAELPKMASATGIDVKQFNTCLASGKYGAKVQTDYNEAVGMGAQGTPYLVLITKDGAKTPISGAEPYDALKSIIDTLLSSATTTAQ